jgi:hypothetical protein
MTMKPSKRTDTRNGTFGGILRKSVVGIVCLVGLVANLLVSNIYNVATATLPVTMTAKTTSRGVDIDEVQQLLKSEAQEQEDEDEGSDFDYVSTLRPKPPAFIFVFWSSGIGSNLLNFFAQAVYLKETRNLNMLADTATYRNRYNETVGLLTGYFTPKFPVIDTPEQQEEFIQPFFSPDQNYTLWREVADPREWGRKNGGPIMVNFRGSYRGEIQRKYTENQLDLYNKMVDMMCPHFQFNPATELRIAEMKRSYGVPLEWDPNQASASFHIRRGDKITGEALSYNGTTYLHKLKQIAPNVTFEHCFVATDDYRAVVEIREALANETVCKNLHNMTQPIEMGHRENSWMKGPQDYAETIQFMAELQSMITTTYFVGTFGSNVGALTSVLRGCHGRNDDYPNYAHSYGVDTDAWYFI